MALPLQLFRLKTLESLTPFTYYVSQFLQRRINCAIVFILFFLVGFIGVTLAGRTMHVSAVQLIGHCLHTASCAHHLKWSFFPPPLIPLLPSSTSPHAPLPLAITIWLSMCMCLCYYFKIYSKIDSFSCHSNTYLIPILHWHPQILSVPSKYIQSFNSSHHSHDHHLGPIYHHRIAWIIAIASQVDLPTSAHASHIPQCILNAASTQKNPVKMSDDNIPLLKILQWITTHRIFKARVLIM